MVKIDKACYNKVIMRKIQELPPLPLPSAAVEMYVQTLHEAEDFTGMKVLDVNCGDGRDSLFLSKLGYPDVQGIDTNHAAIARAIANRTAQKISKERVRFLQKTVADVAIEMPVNKPGFDLAIAVKGLHQHTKSRQKIMLAGMRDITRPLGVNVISGYLDSKHVPDQTKKEQMLKAQMLRSKELCQYYAEQPGWEYKYYEFPRSVRKSNGTLEGDIVEMTLATVIARKLPKLF